MKWFKRHTGPLAIVEFVIIIGLATTIVLLAVSKSHSTTQNQVQSQQPAASTTTKQTATGSYKLGPCKSGATQTVGNAGYLVGTDIAPGSYNVIDPSSDGWSNIDVYSSKVEYDKGQANPNNDHPSQSFQAMSGTPTTTKLSDGQYMNVGADSATLTCQ